MNIRAAKELNLLFLAIGFFTRIPIPRSVHYSEIQLNKASRYFSLVGLILAIFLSAAWYLLSFIFPSTVTVFVVIVLSLMLTGAFHEDGLADTADGLGGAFEKDQKLLIMKDSRLGTYGAAALIMALLGKFILLSELQTPIFALLIAYPLSRAVAGSLIYDMSYVSDIDTSKSKPLANRMHFSELITLICIGLIPLVLIDLLSVFILIMGVLALRLLIKRYLNRQIGGYTGDALGAAQQITELGIYLLLVALQYQTCSEANLCT